MDPLNFSPWGSAGNDASGIPPLKRVSLEQARSLFDEIARTPDQPLAVTRGLALRRYWGLLLDLNPEGENGAEGAGVYFARKLSSATREHLETASLSEDDARAVGLELQLLDRRLQPASPNAVSADPGPDASEALHLEGPQLSGAYGAYVRGLWHAANRHAEAAAQALDEAMRLAAGEPDAERLVARDEFPVLFEAGHDDRLIARARSLVQALSMSGKQLFDLGWALHWQARAQEREGNWTECVEAARESNLRLFQFGASQKARTIGINYYLVARGMAELDEWGEAAALAQLSLRPLQFTREYPGRADALLVLARCLEAFGDEKPRADARGILSRLLDERPPVSNAELFFQAVKKRLDALGEGPVSVRPG